MSTTTQYKGCAINVHGDTKRGFNALIDGRVMLHFPTFDTRRDAVQFAKGYIHARAMETARNVTERHRESST